MPGQLFTHYFLTDGIKATAEWKASVARPRRALLPPLRPDQEDAEYVLDTFPIVRKEDEAAFGRYRTRDLILAYMNALSAGDTETQVAV